jgi:hypothetical protein
LCDCAGQFEARPQVELGVVLLDTVSFAGRGFFFLVKPLIFTFHSFLTFPAFFITICYHTIYAVPWIFPPLAFYAFDIIMRQFRYRIKDAQLIRIDKQMTLVWTFLPISFS